MSSRFSDGKLRGDRHCVQKRLTDGRFVNHGPYSVMLASSRVVLEGRFEEGKKEGIWREFDEKGQVVAERYFENGVEKSQVGSSSREK